MDSAHEHFCLSYLSNFEKKMSSTVGISTPLLQHVATCTLTAPDGEKGQCLDIIALQIYSIIIKQ